MFHAPLVFSNALLTTFGSRLSAGVRIKDQNRGTMAGPKVVSCQSIHRFASARPSGVGGHNFPWRYLSARYRLILFASHRTISHHAILFPQDKVPVLNRRNQPVRIHVEIRLFFIPPKLAAKIDTVEIERQFATAPENFLHVG